MIEQACFFLHTYCYFFSAINLWMLLNKKLLKKKKTNTWISVNIIKKQLELQMRHRVKGRVFI